MLIIINTLGRTLSIIPLFFYTYTFIKQNKQKYSDATNIQ